MRGEAVRCPDALDRTQADADGLGHGAARPMGGFAGRFGKRQINNPLDDIGSQRSLAGPARLVAQQTIDALAHEALLPAPDNRLRQPRPAHDFQRSAAIGRGQNDAGARRMFLRSVAIPDDPIEATPILSPDFDFDACSHTKSMIQITALGNPSYASVHELAAANETGRHS